MGHRIELYCIGTKSKREAIAKWNAGKDFKIVDGPYCSIRDFAQMKKDFDLICLKWLDNDDKVCYHYIWIHSLSGVTTYV